MDLTLSQFSCCVCDRGQGWDGTRQHSHIPDDVFIRVSLFIFIKALSPFDYDTPTTVRISASEPSRVSQSVSQSSVAGGRVATSPPLSVGQTNTEHSHISSIPVSRPSPVAPFRTVQRPFANARPPFPLQARNKPADGSTHLRNSSGQRDKTPSGQKGPAKATAHSAKGGPPGKQGSRSQSQSKIQSVTQAAVTVQPQGNKKKNKKPHDLVVTINLVSKSGLALWIYLASSLLVCRSAIKINGFPMKNSPRIPNSD